jgi:hypothetical protein
MLCIRYAAAADASASRRKPLLSMSSDNFL